MTETIFIGRQVQMHPYRSLLYLYLQGVFKVKIIC